MSRRLRLKKLVSHFIYSFIHPFIEYTVLSENNFSFTQMKFDGTLDYKLNAIFLKLIFTPYFIFPLKTILVSYILLLFTSSVIGQERAKALVKNANFAIQNGEKKTAIDYLLEAITDSEKRKDYKFAANVISILAGQYYENGDYKKASDLCQRGILLYKENGLAGDTVLFKVYAAHAPSLKNQYFAQEALDSYFAGNKLIEAVPAIREEMPLYVGYHYYNQGVFLLKIFDVHQAKVNFEKALEMGIKIKNSELIIDCMISLSSVYSSEEDVAGALQKITTGLGSIKNNNDVQPLDIARSDYLIANLYHKINNKTYREKHLDQVLSNEKILLTSAEGKNVFLKSMFLKALTNPEKSDFLLNKISRPGFIPDYLAIDYLSTLAQIEFDRNNFSASILQYKKALKTLKVSYDPKTKKWESKDLNKAFSLLTKISLAYREMYTVSSDKAYLKLGIESVKNAIEIADEIRANYFTFESKIFFSEKNYQQYKNALNLLYELYASEKGVLEQKELFLLAESSKSYMMNLYQARNEKKRNPKRDSLNLKLAAYNSHIAYLRNNDTQSADILGFEQKANLIFNELKSLSKSRNVFSQPLKFDFDNFKKIPTNQLYVNYILVDKRLLILCANKNGLVTNQVSLNLVEFNYHRALLNTALTSPPSAFEGFSASTSCQYLYRLLIDNLPVSISEFTRLAINPDNNLFDFSFDVLQNPKNKRYLIEDVAISYVTSINDLIKKERFKINERCNVFLPFANQQNILLKNLQPLKFTFESSKGINANFYLDSQSKKSTFIRKLREPLSITILSTHANAKGNEPYLVFNEADDPNSRLYASEIPYFSINSPLVILNACESGVGQKVNGMGMFSLAESFRLAGGKAILGSMWQADEESTAIISSLFYRNVMTGMPKDVALQKAKLSFLSTEVGKRNDLPFYWSHLQLMGDSSEIVTSKKNYFILVGILISLLVFIFWRKYFSKKFGTLS